MDICQDINMYVGCDLASSVSRRKSAHRGADPVCGGLSKIGRHFAFFSRILMARGALLDNYFGQCSYYRSQHAMLL